MRLRQYHTNSGLIVGSALGRISCVLALGFAVPASAGTVDRPFFSVKGVVIVIGASDFSENGGQAPVAVDFNLLTSVSGTAANDIIAVDGVTTNYNTGQHNAISDGSDSGWEYQINNSTFGGNFTSTGPHQTLDANDSYSRFGIDENTDIDLLGGGARASRFLVVSNVAFDIYAEASDIVTTGAFAAMDYSNIRYRLRTQTTGGGGVWRWGQSAQNPANGGLGVTVPNNSTLNTIAGGPTKVFDGGRRTARIPGSLLQQAVGFQSRYNLRGAGINGNNYDFSMGAGSLGATVTYTVYTP